MGAAAFAMQLADLLPHTRVIFRAWPDGTINDLGPAANRVQDMHSWCPDPRVYLYMTNEPHPADAEVWGVWTVEAIQEASRLGRKLCVGNWSMGTPEIDVWLGPWSRVLRTLQNTGHLLGLHEYYAYSWGQNNYPWLVGRYQFVLDTCRQLGVQPPSIVITETGLDGTSAQDHGWRKVGISEDAYADIIEQLLLKWPSPVVGMCIYSWGNSGGWEAFDVSKAYTFQARMVHLANNQPVPPTPEPVPEPEPEPEPAPPVDERWEVMEYYLRQLATWCIEIAEAVRAGQLPADRK